MANPIHVESRRKNLSTIESLHPSAKIIDVTSKAEEPWVRFSPFFPHGGIPIPGMPGESAQSVEGLWQGLKVFESEGVDPSKWRNTSMKGIKRSVRSRGRVLGHWFRDELLGYLEARKQIYLPAYRWALENCLADELEQLAKIADQTEVGLARLRDQLRHSKPVQASLACITHSAIPTRQLT